MLSYNLTEIKLADLKNRSLFFIKNKYFQKSLPTKAFDKKIRQFVF